MLHGSHKRIALRGGQVMVRPAGFEPTTPGLGILCSILLSYGRIVAPTLIWFFF